MAWMNQPSGSSEWLASPTPRRIQGQTLPAKLQWLWTVAPGKDSNPEEGIVLVKIQCSHWTKNCMKKMKIDKSINKSIHVTSTSKHTDK